MNKLLAILIVPIFLAVNFGFTFPDKPANNTRVVDQTGKLTATQIKQLNARIKDIENTNKAQVAMLIVPTLGDETIETAANEVFRKWGIGDKKLSNGVLLMLSMKERKMRIEVGYGLESTLTDSFTQSVIQTMKSPLRQGNLYAATGVFVGSINTRLIKAVDVEKSTKSAPVSDSIPVWLFSLLLGAGLFGLYVIYKAFKPKKKTKKEAKHHTDLIHEINKAKVDRSTILAAGVAGYATAKVLENTKKKKASNDDSYSSSGYSSLSSSSSSSDYSSGSSSDSGSSFGSFGGGDSGGGGSSGDW